MGSVFIDGFDHYATLLPLRRKWDQVSSSDDILINAVSPRTGAGKLLVTATNGVVKKCVPAKDTYIVGFAYRRQNSSGGAFNDICQLQAEDFTSQIEIQYQGTTGKFRIGNSVFTSAETGPIDTSTNWVFLELKVEVGGPGAWEFRVDGVTLLSGSNNTDPAGTGVIEWVGIGRIILSQFDDFYLFDAEAPYPTGGAGPTNDDFLGPCFVYTLWPIGDGPVNNGVGSDGNSVDNFLLVDDSKDVAGAHDSDTTYVQLNTDGHKDLYIPDNAILPTGVEVHAVQVTAYARRVGLDAKDFRPVIMDSGGTWTSNGEFVFRLPDGQYGLHTGIWDRDPNNATPQQWTKALVESRRYGGLRQA